MELLNRHKLAKALGQGLDWAAICAAILLIVALLWPPLRHNAILLALIIGAAAGIASAVAYRRSEASLQYEAGRPSTVVLDDSGLRYQMRINDQESKERERESDKTSSRTIRSRQ